MFYIFSPPSFQVQSSRQSRSPVINTSGLRFTAAVPSSSFICSVLLVRFSLSVWFEIYLLSSVKNTKQNILQIDYIANFTDHSPVEFLNAHAAFQTGCRRGWRGVRRGGWEDGSKRRGKWFHFWVCEASLVLSCLSNGQRSTFIANCRLHCKIEMKSSSEIQSILGFAGPQEKLLLLFKW